jgi:hypothetical protein
MISPPETVHPPIFPVGVERRRSSTRQPLSKAPKVSSAKHDGADQRPVVELVLYISSVSPHSTAALRNLRRALADFTSCRIGLTVHDLSKEPERAERDGVHFTPALVTAGRGPRTWIVGHLGNPQVLQTLLESAIDSKE